MADIQGRPTCGYCGGYHQDMGTMAQPILCKLCGVCWQYCEHMEGCTWPEARTNPAEKKKGDNMADNVKPNVDVAKVADALASVNLQEAFEAWYVSSKYTADGNTPVETIWKEFEMFAKEVLTPVEPGKMYLHVTIDSGNVKNTSLDLLDASHLYRNQDGEYVIVEGKRRTRIGKNVAVMG